MSKFFNIAKANYDSGAWNKAMIANLVVRGRITAEEYEIITGEAYPA